MPLVIYMFSLCAFALGLTEFLVIGLVSAISVDLHTTIEAIGMTVTSYAIGATIGAPVLTALTSSWPRKSVMIATMLVFSLGSMAATFSTSVNMMLVSRFVAGLAHGLFLAVSANVATQIVEPNKRGSAVSYVFAGLTLALAFGVPIGTYLGSVISWRLSFMSVTVCGVIGLLGLLFLMPKAQSGEAENRGAVATFQALSHIADPILLFAALITILGYTGAFTLYTYIAPLLYDVTGVSVKVASYMMLVYGIFAAIGNILGGKLTDWMGADRAVTIVMLALSVTLASIHLFGSSTIAMCFFVAAMGAISYAAVPAMQARVINIANTYVPGAAAVASGLNIAGFNSGIALGSLLGGVLITSVGIGYLAIVGAAITLFGLIIMLLFPLTKRRFVAGKGHL